MDLKDIQALIRFISSSGVDEVSIERKDFKLNIKKNQKTTEVVMSSQQVSYQQAPPVASAPRMDVAPAAEAPIASVEIAPSSKLF